MNKHRLVFVLSLAAVTALVGAGLVFWLLKSPTAPRATVAITYVADFEGETASGYLNLVMDMIVENDGYDSFDASPANFAVKVGKYTYPVKDSQLGFTQLPDGGKAEGRLVFQVPPEAALPKVGYQVTYSDQKTYNVQWINSPEDFAKQSSSASGPAIDIPYKTTLMWLPAPGTQYLKVDPPGNLYLVVEMTIENVGYEAFDTNPDFFSVDVSSTVRSVTSEVEEELIDWRELNIPNGGKYTGLLAFHIPTEVAQSFYRWEYTMAYNGVRSYNVNFRELNVSKCFIDGAETELEAVYLPDGDAIEGTLAFEITREMASPTATYEMQYDEETSHNVQWFDSPDASADVDRNPVAYPVIKITYSTRVEKNEDRGRLYVIVDVLIENKGYESFLTSPANFILEVNY